jgi:hypothetical protein
MLDVVLYGHDRQGLLILKERRFRSMKALAAFFRTPKASHWEWAEVDISADHNHSQMVKYTADELRSIVDDLDAEAGNGQAPGLS